MKTIFVNLTVIAASLFVAGCGGNGAVAPVLPSSTSGFFVYTVYGAPGVSIPDPGVAIAGSVPYPQSCQNGSSGCNLSFNAKTDPKNGTYTFATNDIPDTWTFSRLSDANCPGGGNNAITYPGYLVGSSGETIVLNCSFSQVYAAYLASPVVYVGYQQTPPSQTTIYSDRPGLFGNSAVTVRSYNTNGNVEDQLSGAPASGGNSMSIPFDSTLATPGYHMLALPSASSTSTYAAAVTLQTVQVNKGNTNPCGTKPNCPNPN